MNPLGGLIHFGYTNSNIDKAEIAKILSQYVGAITILIEDEKTGLKRRCDYGYYTDYRAQPYGMEYRTCSSWLTSPYVAAGVLCLSKTVMYEILNNSQFKWEMRVGESDFNNMNIPIIRSYFPSVWNDITKMYLYQKYKINLDLLYFLVNNNLTWFPVEGTKAAWGIVNPHPEIMPTYRAIGLNTIWGRYLSEREENG